MRTLNLSIKQGKLYPVEPGTIKYGLKLIL